MLTNNTAFDLIMWPLNRLLICSCYSGILQSPICKFATAPRLEDDWCCVGKCVPLGAESQVWSEDVNFSPSGKQQPTSQWPLKMDGSTCQTPPLCYNITKLDINGTGKWEGRGTALLIHETHLHINSAPFHGRQTYARGGPV